MEEVLKKLSEIETTAQKIMDEAERQKLAMSEEFKKRIQDYDKQTEEAATQEIARIRSDLEHNKESQLEALNQKTESILTSLDQYYEENRERLCHEIFQRITEI